MSSVSAAQAQLAKTSETRLKLTAVGKSSFKLASFSTPIRLAPLCGIAYIFPLYLAPFNGQVDAILHLAPLSQDGVETP